MSGSAEHFQRGVMLLNLHRAEEAQEAFMLGLAGDPENAWAHAMVALCFSNRGMAGPCMNWARKAVALDPECPTAFYALTMAHLQLRQTEKAFKAIDAAIALDPLRSDYHSQKARMLLLLRRHAWAAQLAAEAGLRSNPRHEDSLDMLAEALMKQGRHEQAAKVVAMALSINPESVPAQAKLGWEQLRRGEHVEALARFREALRLNPSDSKARVGFVEALKSQNWFYQLAVRLTMPASFGLQRLSGLPRGTLAIIAVAAPSLLGCLIVPILLVTDTNLVPSWFRYSFLALLVIAALGFGILLAVRFLSDLAMPFHQQGQYALPRTHLLGAFSLAGLLLWAAITVPVAISQGSYRAILTACLGLFFVPVLSMAITAPASKRLIAWLVAGGASAFAAMLIVVLPPEEKLRTFLVPLFVSIALFYRWLYKEDE